MPEWNSVTKMGTRWVLAWGVILVAATAQMGCSKLSQSSYKDDLLGLKSNQTEWSTDSAERNLADTQVLPDKTRQDSARILIAPESQETIKLVAKQPAPSIAALENPAGGEACAHEYACDCHRPKTKPELPFAEPVDFPSSHSALSPLAQSTPSANHTPAHKLLATSASPVPQRPQAIQLTSPAAAPVMQGAANRSLSPILFNPETRKALPHHEITTKVNSLRRNQRWSHEQTAILEQKPNSFEPLQSTGQVNPGPAESAPRDEPRTINAKAKLTPVMRRSEPSTSQDFAAQATHACANCHQPNCDGRCAKPKQRAVARNLQPVVSPDPIVIVATTTSETIPPFAESPADDAMEQTPTLTMTTPPPTIRSMAPEQGENSATERLEDEAEDDKVWSAMFAHVAKPAPDCADCQTGGCEDPECDPKNTIALATVDSNSKSSSDFVPQHINQAEPIASAADNNNSMSVTHLADIAGPANETTTVAANGLTAPQPKQPPAHSNSQWQPPNRLLKANAKPKSPGAAKASNPTKLPAGYRGPAVRIEVIDNTVPWEQQIADAIKNVQSRLSTESEPETRNGLEVNLRLLEVLQRQMWNVEDRQDTLSNEERLYWQHQLDAIGSMLDSDENHNSDLLRHHTAINTLDHLRKAVERLESIADLKISNGEFCTQISGFGQFKTFPDTNFGPTQRMLVYCEVENYKSNQRDVNAQPQVHTKLRGSYAIYDPQGRAVQQSDYPIVDDVARKRRRDFYMHFPIELNNLPAGQYTLQLLVEDLNGNSSASLEPFLKFQVR